MSNLGSLRGQAMARIPTPPRGEPIARYETYLEAQRAVDFLSDQHFPVQFVTIVGSGLRMVERVTGRLTYPRVATAGAASGAWFGSFVGVLLYLYGGGNTAVFVAAVVIGAGFGMLFGVISYSFTGGRRDFTSTSQIVATEYEVLCMPEQAQSARELLWRLPGGRGRAGAASGPGSTSGSGYGTPPGQGATPPSGGAWPPAAGGGAYGGGGAGYGALPPPTAAPTSTTPPEGVPATGPAVEVTGPTYGEMIEKQRREQREREAQEARERAERERLQREQPADPGQASPRADGGQG